MALSQTSTAVPSSHALRESWLQVRQRSELGSQMGRCMPRMQIQLLQAPTDPDDARAADPEAQGSAVDSVRSSRDPVRKAHTKLIQLTPCKARKASHFHMLGASRPSLQEGLDFFFNKERDAQARGSQTLLRPCKCIEIHLAMRE